MKMPDNSISMVGGVGPYDEITMGGMFTILKVRAAENFSNYDEDPGWYEPPRGTLASLAPADVMRDNGVATDASTAPRAPLTAMKSWEQAKPPPGQAPAETPHDHRDHGGHHPGHGGTP
jgi:hypothetical protein